LGGQDIGVKAPETRYAWIGDVALAYQVVGEGPVDVLYYQGWSSNIDLAWESPYLSRFLRGYLLADQPSELERLSSPIARVGT
jgi:hypothetical protein